MPRAATARINPAVLKWVMDSEGWDAAELAAETGLGAERIREWTAVQSDISLRDLERISARFTRPMSVLFMDRAPPTTVPLYRRGGGAGGAEAPPRLSRPVLEVVRRARYVQGSAAELLEALGRGADPDVRRASTGQDPEKAAAEGAAALGIGAPRRAGRGPERDRRRYSEIREGIESRNVFTMQERIPGDGPAGLALADAAPAVVLADGGDPPRRRIFTMLHEYAHVVLGDGASACPAADHPRGGGGGEDGVDDDDAERWCDRFAAAVLMPRDAFLAELGDAHGAAGGDPLAAADCLADRFCVDRAAAAERAAGLLGPAGAGAAYCGCIGGAPAREPGGLEAGGSGSGAQNRAFAQGQAAQCVARKGRRYASLVLEASDSGDISTSTALDYLEIKLKNLGALRALCWGG